MADSKTAKTGISFIPGSPMRRSDCSKRARVISLRIPKLDSRSVSVTTFHLLASQIVRALSSEDMMLGPHLVPNLFRASKISRPTASVDPHMR